MSKERKYVLEESIDFDLDRKVDGKTIQQVVESLLDIQNTYPTITFRFDVRYYDEYCELILEGSRPETDEEYETRLAVEERNKKYLEQIKEAKEREEYERLAKKFGKSVS